MSSEVSQKKLNQLKTVSVDRQSEGYSSNNEDPNTSPKKQGSRASSNQGSHQKAVSLSNVSKNHTGSLETLHEDVRIRAATTNAPTFGEDELNAVVADQVLSVLPSKKGNLSKIDMLLEEHKKRKALQNYYEFQNDDDSPSPMSVQAKSPKTSDKTPVGFPQGDQELLLSPIEPKSLIQESQSALQANSDFHSFRYENGKQVYNSQESYQFHQSSDSPDDFGVVIPGLVANHEETGRFKGSARSIEFNDKNISSDLKEKYQLPSKFSAKAKSNNSKVAEKKEYKRTDSTTSKYSSHTSNTNNTTTNNINNNNNNNNNASNGIPKISENSKKIFQNSQRAKEDEILIQTLLKTHIRKLSSGVTQENPAEEQNVLEETEAPPAVQHKFVRLPSSVSPKSDKDQSRISINFAPENAKSNRPKSTASANSSMVKDANITQNTSFTPSVFSSAKKSTSKKTFMRQSTSDQGSSPSSSPKNIRSNTVVEHKKRPSRLDEHLTSYRKRTGAQSAHVSPTVKEIKEMVNAPKSIYLRMAQKNVKVQESASASPTRKAKNSSPKRNHSDIMGSKLVQKCAENAKRPTVNRLGPEEVDKYDEIQRLDIMMYNLRQIQRANLMSDLYTFRMNNPKPAADIVYTTKTDWNNYADEINEVASERRWFRRMEEQEKIAKMALPPSPRPMEKVEMSVDSLMTSTQLRQQMLFATEEEKANLKSWNETGLYDRSVMWLAVRDHKLDQMGQVKAVEEMRDCLFQPQLQKTQAYNSSFIGSYSRTQTETPASFLQSLSDRFHPGKDNNSGLMGLLTEKSIYRNDKSLYKERKGLESYSDIFDLKKAYNLYKGPRETTQRTSNSVIQ